jgi:hypothetical protein
LGAIGHADDQRPQQRAFGQIQAALSFVAQHLELFGIGSLTPP